MFGLGKRWTPGEKLKLLFAGYNGNRNTGSDLRVQETLRQIRHVLGAENVDFSVMTRISISPAVILTARARCISPTCSLLFLFREVRANHGVIACEGSMFKSKFANALTTMMIGSLGIASAENKLSVGYGGEAGHMDPLIERMCARYVKDSVIIPRSAESQTLLSKLSIPTELGTDTAWTFEPHPPEYGAEFCAKPAGTRRHPFSRCVRFFPSCGRSRLLWRNTSRSRPPALTRTASIGPFISIIPARLWMRKTRAISSHLQRLPRHSSSATKFSRFFVAMERLDARACLEFAAHLGHASAPIFTSEDYDIFQLVSILRQSSLMVSSRTTLL